LSTPNDSGRVVGRYVLYDEIASGGMATIHLGRLLGQVGFARTVAIKRLHPHFAKDPEFVAMFIDEARLAAGIRHPNVVSTLDVVALEGDLFLVMDYVDGDSLAHLVKRVRARDQLIPPAVVSGVVTNVLYGLHAAHTAKDERGEQLHVVHRDISPQNILVGLDGVARVADFGVAKASRRIQETEAGRIKGKFRYMAPEQVKADRFDHRVDLFAAGIVLWEALTGRALFAADEPMRTMTMVLEHPIEAPSRYVAGLSPAVDAVVLRALERSPDARYATAREMAIELEDALPPAVPRIIGEWVDSLVGDTLRKRAQRLVELGSESNVSVPLATPLGGLPVDAGAAPAVAASTPAVAAEASAASASGAAAPEPAVVAAAAPATPLSVAVDEPAGVGATAGVPAHEVPLQVQPAPMAPPQVAAVATPSLPVAPVAPFEHTPSHAGPLRTEPSSQISEVSTAAWDTAAQRSLFPVRDRRALKVALAAVAGSMLVFLVGLVLVLRSRAPAAEAPDVIGVPATAAAARAPKAAPKPETPPAVAPPVVSIPTASATPEEPAPAATPKPEALKPKPVPAVKPVTKPAGDCNPPYVIENGIKKFKRHCM
jgi:serine/threonine-protein kinase